MKQQRCVSEQFIVINDDLNRLARDFYFKRKEGEREQYSRDRERVCVRGRALQREEDSVSIKIDC